MTDLHLISTADAVTRPALPPVDPEQADIVLARLFGDSLKFVEERHVRALAAALIVADSLELGGAE